MSIESRRHQYGTVFGHWQIGELLGASKNGQTAVFHLQHKESGQEESAVKVITLIEEQGRLKEYTPQRKAEYEAELNKRKLHALNEVQIMYALKGYTNIVSYEDRVTEHWTENNSFGCDLLIRMELLRDLRKIIRTGYIFSEAETIKIGKDICTALILCHGEEDPIIHRDIKPENIFVNSRGTYKLGDFGVSRILDRCQGTTATTAIGTPAYLAPEQTQKGYDVRVDIYSLGLVLYELSNQNRLPFAETAYDAEKAILLRMAGNKLPAPSNASAALAKVILKACAFKAGDRYQTAKEMFAALDKLTESTPSCASESVDPSATSISQTFETVPVVATQGDGNAFATIPAIPNAGEVATKTGQPQLLAADENKSDLQARADSGDAAAQNEMGDNYYYGRGVSIDYAKAFFWYQKAAEQGLAEGQFNLGMCYWDGQGIEQSDAKSAEWYQKAAEQGNAVAQVEIGMRYDYGWGVKRNKAKAAEWYQKAANQGNVGAMHRVGDMYYAGNGVQKDVVLAMDYYLKAMNKNFKPAAIQYGLVLTNASKKEKVKLGTCGHKFENIPKQYVEEIEEKIEKEKEANKQMKAQSVLVLKSLIIPAVALLAGCLMWFALIPIWINITALSVMGIATGIVARAMLCTIGKKKGFKLRPLAYPVFCVAGAIGVPLVTAIVIAIIEGILWFCG